MKTLKLQARNRLQEAFLQTDPVAVAPGPTAYGGYGEGNVSPTLTPRAV